MKKIAWGITGGGHFLKESVELLGQYGDLDLFVSPAGMELLEMYSLRPKTEPVTDETASSVSCRAFAGGVYNLFVIAPATSNTVAKFVYGISDTAITTLFAQCGKSRLPIIVLPTDVEEDMESCGVTKPVKIHPRPVDLENMEKLVKFPGVTVVKSTGELESAIAAVADVITG